MKLTWFSGTTLRVHIGGSILVCDPAGISGVDPDELVSGADRVFALGAGLERVDPSVWQPARVGTMLDDAPEVQVLGIEGGAIVFVPGEAPLVLVTGPLPRLGRWGRDAVFVVFGEEADRLAAAVLDEIGPQLIAIAAPEAAVDRTFAALAVRLEGTGMVALDAGLALEV